ncbi:MAG: peptidylprolyl isomerase [Bryobacteraceae bacterium]
MKLISASLLVCASLFAQATAPQPAPASPTLMTAPPATVVAVIDGQKVTASELQAVLRAVAPAQQEAAMKDPRAFLQQFALMRRLSSMAEKAGLDQQSPLREQLAYNRMLALAQAQLRVSEAKIVITPEEAKQFYEGNQDLYTSVRLKVIYIPFSPNPPATQPEGQKKVLSEPEAKATAEKVYADLRGGADFVKMVKEFSGDATSASKDGDFGSLRRSDRIPEDVKAVVFALKAGEISRPVRQPNGFYIFRAEELSTEPLEKVQKAIMEQLRQTRMNSLVQDTQKSIEIKLENEALLAPAAPPAPAAAK